MGLHWVDLLVLCSTIAFIIIFGIVKTRQKSNQPSSFLRGNEETKWWNIGISVMATQASAITFMSTPGQAYHDGMGFVQFYFGLPIAMVIICIFFIPLFQNLKVYTAYEYLEQRFDLNTRTFTAFLFMLQRGLGTGITIYAPSIVLSTIFGWNLMYLNIIIGLLVILYTLSGGTKAVAVTQQHQMFIMIGGMIVVFITSIKMLPENLSFSNILQIAADNGKMKIIDPSFDLGNRYTIWSGLTGGMFLALAYFGTDQSQVQRFITGSSIKESRLGLVFNGLLKIPMQFFILLCGIMVFVFYQYNKAPIFFNNHTLNEVRQHPVHQTELAKLEKRYDGLFNEKLQITQSDTPLKVQRLMAINDEEKAIRKEVQNLIKQTNPKLETNDKDYVFISFVLSFLPIGVIGLLLAVIFCAAMSATASGINALATSTTIDIYKNLYRNGETESHYVKTGKIFTLIWGLLCIAFANLCTLFENLIQFVNIVGSVFYGTILGIFVTGIFTKTISGKHVLWAAVFTEAIILFLYFNKTVEYLWLNPIGCFLVIGIASIFNIFSLKSQKV